PSSNGNFVVMADTGQSRMEIDASRVKSTDVMSGRSVRSSTTRAAATNDRVALIRGPLEGTNKGRNPKSRRYIRGVLHSHPVSMAVGAVLTLILFFVLPVAIVSAGL